MPKPPPTALVSAASRGTRKKREPIALAIQQALNNVEYTLGGRSQLIAVLAQNPSTTAIATLLSDLANPEHDNLGLATLCFMNGLTTGDLLRAYQAGLRLYAQTLAVVEIASKEVAVTRDVMERALPYETECPTCHGTTEALAFNEQTKRVESSPCRACRQTGKVTIVPDLDRQKVALDLAELLPKKGGLAIGINQTTIQGGAPAGGFGGTLEKLQQTVGNLLYGEAIEAEILPNPDGPLE